MKKLISLFTILIPTLLIAGSSPCYVSYANAEKAAYGVFLVGNSADLTKVVKSCVDEDEQVVNVVINDNYGYFLWKVHGTQFNGNIKMCDITKVVFAGEIELEKVCNGKTVEEEYKQIDYKCVDQKNEREDIILTIYDGKDYLINGLDSAIVDSTYSPVPSNKNLTKLDGVFESIGEGTDGGIVELFVNKYIVSNADYGLLYYYHKSGSEVKSSKFKCTKFSPNL